MTTSSRAIALLAVLVLSVFGIAACGDDDSGGGDTGSADTTTGNTDATVGYASPVATQPNQIDIDQGMERTAEQYGWDFEVLDSDLSPDKQVSDVDTFISQDFDGSSFWSLDPGAMNAALERASEEGMPLVGLNSEGKFVNTNVVWEVYQCSDDGPHAQSVEYIQERKGENARVLQIGPPPVPVLLESAECFAEKAKAAGLEIVDRQDNIDDSVASATPIVSDLLQKHDNIDAVWSYNDTTALGASAAIDNAGLSIYSEENEDGVVTIGSNADAEAIEAIEAGRLTATWDVNSAETGAAAMLAMAPVINEGADPSTMPSEIVITTELVDASNIGEYVPPADRELDLDLNNLPAEVTE